MTGLNTGHRPARSAGSSTLAEFRIFVVIGVAVMPVEPRLVLSLVLQPVMVETPADQSYVGDKLPPLITQATGSRPR